MGLTLRRVYEGAVLTLTGQQQREVELLANGLDRELQAVAVIADDTARFLGQQPSLDAQAMVALLAGSLSLNPLIQGAALAFEPFALRADQRLFAPYVFGADATAVDLAAVVGDYTEGGTAWYREVRAAGRPVWSEPRRETLGGAVTVVTYAVPIRAQERFIGVASLDLRLDRLSELLAAGESAQFMVMSRRGRFVAHSDAGQVLQASLQDLVAAVDSAAFQSIANRILAGERGVAVLGQRPSADALPTGELWISHAPIPINGWSLATLTAEAQLIAPIRAQIELALLGLGLTMVLIFLLVWWMSSRLTRPIKLLEAAVSEVARGRLDTHIENIRSTDELGRLSRGFNRMLKNLKKQIARQSQQETASRLVERELHLARETQRSLLPGDFTALHGPQDFTLHAVNQAARHVAGDFFDYFLVSPGTLVFVIADVSGKGLSAALVMAVTRTMVRDLAQSGRRPGEILRETNERLRESRRSGAFVTLFLGIYHSASGQVTYANGGHLPPYLISSTGEVATVGEATGTIVGMLEQQDYQDAEFTLQPGDTLLLHTDGYPEARSPAGEFYGTSRIKHFLQRHARGSVRELCDAITAEIAAFQHDSLSDDLTLLALRRSVRSVNVA